MNCSRALRGNGPLAATGRNGSINAHSASVTSKRTTPEFYQPHADPHPPHHRSKPKTVLERRGSLASGEHVACLVFDEHRYERPDAAAAEAVAETLHGLGEQLLPDLGESTPTAPPGSGKHTQAPTARGRPLPKLINTLALKPRALSLLTDKRCRNSPTKPACRCSTRGPC